MTVVLREPKRKHRGNVAETLPFPIHTERATGIPVCEATWHIYTGRYNGDSVIVENLEDIHALYSMGYYGKGSLSRGCAVLGRAKRKLPPFINESQWHRHKQWMLLGSNKEKVVASDDLNNKSTDNQNNETPCDHKTGDKAEDGTKKKSNEGAKPAEQNVMDLVDVDSECSDIEEVDTSGEVKNKKRKLETESPKQSLKIGKSAAAEGSRVLGDPLTEQTTALKKSVSEETRVTTKSAVEETTVKRKSVDEETGIIGKSAAEETTSNRSVDQEMITIRESVAEDTNTVKKSTAEEAQALEKSGKEGRRVNQSSIEVVDLSSDEECPQTEPPGKKYLSTVEPSKPVCSATAGESTCENAEVVVLAGVDSDDEDYLTKLKPRLEHEPSHLSQEKLILSLEEAMFLSYGLGCLRILGLSGEELSLLEIWKLFQETQNTFVQRYVAYHYFRSKGWVVKSGLKYGGDFVLYKEGPHLYHSSYVVVVQVISGSTSARCAARDRRQMNWTLLMGLTRLAEAAGKETLLCQVIWPTHLRENILSSPRVISSFKVQEVLLRRWVASQDRTDHLKNRDGDVNAGIAVESACA